MATSTYGVPGKWLIDPYEFSRSKGYELLFPEHDNLSAIMKDMYDKGVRFELIDEQGCVNTRFFGIKKMICNVHKIKVLEVPESLKLY